MLFALAVRVNRWIAAHKWVVRILTGLCFAAISADYAGFIDLPTIVVVPFWIGVIFNMLRWTLWRSRIKPLIDARMAQAEAKTRAAGETLTG